MKSRTRRGMLESAAVIFLAAVLSGAPAGEISAQTKREALKVIQALQKIEAESAARKSKPSLKMDFSESEFNSYIAYRIDGEAKKVMTELKLKLFDDNRIEGKTVLDLRGQQLPSFLRPDLTLYFEGLLITENGWARADFQKLFVETQQIPLSVLDLIIYAAAKASGDEAGTANQWYLLPTGIRDLKTSLRTISVFY